MSTPEIKEEIREDVSLRTIYRDLEQLEQVGFPIVHDDGKVCLHTSDGRGWTIPVEPTHVLALRLVRRLLDPARGTWLADPLDELEQRLRVLLTPKGRAYCDELAELTTATLTRPAYLDAKASACAARIEEAIHMEHSVRLRYQSSRGEMSERTVDPHGIWFAAGRVYLVAWCHRARDFRTFALQRIVEAAVLEQTFERQPGFNLDTYVEKGFGVFHDDEMDVVLELASDVAHVARERLIHPSQRWEELGGGDLRLHLKVGGLPELAAWIVSFGGGVKAIEPRILVDEVLRRYRAGLAAQEATTISEPMFT